MKHTTNEKRTVNIWTSQQLCWCFNGNTQHTKMQKQHTTCEQIGVLMRVVEKTWQCQQSNTQVESFAEQSTATLCREQATTEQVPLLQTHRNKSIFKLCKQAQRSNTLATRKMRVLCCVAQVALLQHESATKIPWRGHHAGRFPRTLPFLNCDEKYE